MKMLSNTPPARNSKELWKHFSDTYFSLRAGLAVLAFAMPLVLYFYGKYRHGLDLQPSMSAYFWAATKDQCATFPMRTFFVGFLFAVGVGLYVYKGLTPLENLFLNLAAVCAVVVAIYPERLPEIPDSDRLKEIYLNCPAVEVWAALPPKYVHWIAAATLFVLLALVAWLCARNSLEYLPPDSNKAGFERTYKIIAFAMILFPLYGIAVAWLLGQMPNKIFFIEAAGMWTFGFYWATKSRELALSRLEKDPEQAVAHAKQREGKT